MKTYKMEAESLEQVIELALKQFLSEPDEQYLENSFEIDTIIEEWYPDENYDINKIASKL